MTQEEKAKAYDEALEKARQFSEHPLQEDSANIVEYIFPELAESEDEFTIPFGAKDSELIEETYFIPEGMEAVIEGDKIVIKKKESEDERIRKALLDACNLSYSDLWEKRGVKKESILAWLEKQGEHSDKGEISDGFHTFNELYYYRMLYNAAFFNMLPKEWVHKSKKHNGGEECFGGGWFIVMANLPTGQISNHYELKDWDLFQIPEKERADKWDGHTPQEAAERLHNFLLEKQGKTFTKKDVADAYLRGISDAKHELKKQSEQKSVEWSEEDDRALGIAILALNRPYECDGKYDREFAIKWLKSLKDRIK